VGRPSQQRRPGKPGRWPDRVSKLAAKTGLSQTGLLAGLAELLPQLIDRMTPNGEVPKGPDDARSAGRAASARVPGDAEAPARGNEADEKAAVEQTDPTEPVRSGSTPRAG
jgi:YidB-like protein